MSDFVKTQKLAKDLLEAIDRLKAKRTIQTINGQQTLVETRKNQPTVNLPIGRQTQISSARTGSFR